MKKIIAVLLAFLLTGTLILFCVTFTARQVILPAMSGNGAQVSDAVIREELKDGKRITLPSGKRARIEPRNLAVE